MKSCTGCSKRSRPSPARRASRGLTPAGHIPRGLRDVLPVDLGVGGMAPSANSSPTCVGSNGTIRASSIIAPAYSRAHHHAAAGLRAPERAQAGWDTVQARLPIIARNSCELLLQSRCGRRSHLAIGGSAHPARQPELVTGPAAELVPVAATNHSLELEE